MLPGLVQSRPNFSTVARGAGLNGELPSNIGRKVSGPAVLTSSVPASIARTPSADTGILPCVMARPLSR